MKFREILKEYFQKEKINEKHARTVYLLAILPTILFTMYAQTKYPPVDIPSIIFLTITTVSIYIMSVMCGVVSIMFYSGFQVVKPRVDTRITHIKNIIEAPQKINQIESILDKIDLETDQRFNSNITEIKRYLVEIAESQKQLKTKKVGETFTEIYERLIKLEQKDELVRKLQLKVQTLSANVSELTEEIKRLKGE